MGEIHVNLDSIESGQAGIRKSYQALCDTLSELETGLRPMLETWSGSAREAYGQCKKQWDDAAVELAEVLQSVGRAVGDAHQNYQATHDATKQIWL